MIEWKAILVKRLALLFASILATAGAQDTLPVPGHFDADCDRARSVELATRANTALSGGDPTMATTLFRRALEACPSEEALKMELSRSLVAERKFEEGIATAQEYLAARPESVPGMVTLANALFMGQEWLKCREVLEQALAKDPDNRTALLLKGNNEYILDNADAGIDALLHLLDLYPEDAHAAYTLGRIYYMENRAEYAMGQFQRVLKLAPKHYKAWDNLALCYDALGNAEMAIRHFLTAIKLVKDDHPEYYWPYANLADLLLRQNRFQEAYQAASEAARRNPYSARNFFLGGKALTKLDRTEDAIRWLERSVELDPDYPDSFYALGQLYIKTGQREKGMETLKEFRKVKANAPKVRR